MLVSDQSVSGPNDVADMLHELFRNANDEMFEDGMTSHFSDTLHHIIQEHGMGPSNNSEQ